MAEMTVFADASFKVQFRTTLPTEEARNHCRIDIAMRRSSFRSCIIPPTMKAKRHSHTTSFVNPEKAIARGGFIWPPRWTQGSACVTIRSSGMDIPVMPTGIASATHMMDAQATVARTALPSSLNPGRFGRKKRIEKKAVHAAR